MINEDVKRIDIKEFRERGYLQEVNRQFFHPLGLALEIKIDEDGKESLGGVWDYRDDDSGIHFALTNPEFTDKDRLESFNKKYNFIENEFKNRKSKREKILGFFIEPIPKDR